MHETFTPSSTPDHFPNMVRGFSAQNLSGLCFLFKWPFSSHIVKRPTREIFFSTNWFCMIPIEAGYVIHQRMWKGCNVLGAATNNHSWISTDGHHLKAVSQYYLGVGCSAAEPSCIVIIIIFFIFIFFLFFLLVFVFFVFSSPSLFYLEICLVQTYAKLSQLDLWVESPDDGATAAVWNLKLETFTKT